MAPDWYLDSRLVGLRQELVAAMNAWNDLAPEPGSGGTLSDEQHAAMERCRKADEAYYEAWKSMLWLRRQTRPRL